MTKEERKQLYRTDLKEYKRLKRIEWYEDMKVYKRAKDKERWSDYYYRRQTPERKAKRAEVNRRYREKRKKV